jgi:hypothetical protein
MEPPRPRLRIGCWATDTAFFLFLLGFQLPTAGLQWVASRFVKSSDTFRTYIFDLFRWRR